MLFIGFMRAKLRLGQMLSICEILAESHITAVGIGLLGWLHTGPTGEAKVEQVMDIPR